MTVARAPRLHHDTVRPLRSAARAVAAALVCASLLAACGTYADSETSGTSSEPAVSADGTAASSPSASSSSPKSEPASTTPAPTQPVEAAEFPVTIPHKYGETTIEEWPERIVVVGLTEQDALLALGVAPVAVTDWFGGYDYAAWPWAQPYLGDAEPVVLDDTDGIPFEQVAALEPDVIVGLYAGLTDQDYATLSAIAPTVAQPGEYVDWGIPWQEETRVLGQIVGQAERANEMVEEVEAQIEAVRAANPEFIGATGAMATPYEGIWVYAPEDVRGRFLTSLGFVMPPELEALATDEFGFDLSLERLDLLDLDVLIWLDAEDAGEKFSSNEIYNSLAVHTEGRDILLDSESPDALGGATSFVTVLSLPFLLDGLVPQLAAAIDGDPTT